MIYLTLNNYQMKIKGILVSLSLVMMAFSLGAVNKSNSAAVMADGQNVKQMEVVSAASQAMTKAEVKEIKKEQRKVERIERIQKELQKYGVDFSDPVNKWMWYWIFAWGAAIVVSILAWGILSSTVSGFGILGLLSSLLWLAGTISLVIWLVKKFG